MPEDIAVFEESIYESIGVAAFTALRYHDEGDLNNAAALINEWTNENGECLLTYWFDEKMHEVEGELIWCNSEEGDKFEHGTVHFEQLT